MLATVTQTKISQVSPPPLWVEGLVEMAVTVDIDEMAGGTIDAAFTSCTAWVNCLKVKVSEDNIDEMQ